MGLLGNILRDQSGNFGMLTAIVAVPVIGAAGMAIDISRALTLRSDLMGVADAAALGAISEGSPGYKVAQKMTQDGEVTLAQTDGRQIFLAQRGVNSGDNVASMPLDVSIKVMRQNGQVTSTASFNAQMPTTFMRILGKEEMSISGSATAMYGGQNKSYTNFYMLLDNTPSMGIAATRQQMDKLIAATSGPERQAGDRECAFACHLGWTGGDGKFNEDPNSTYKVARANGITLRIDVVANAAEALINKVKAEMSASADQYRIAAYSFGKYALEPGYRIDKVSSLTVDMSSASKAVGDVALMTTDHHGFNQDALTSFDTALSAIGKEISGNGGSGASSGDPQKVVYFVTDGMGDSLKPGGSCSSGTWYGNQSRCLEPIDPKSCQALKDRGIKLAVLYTTYIPLDGDGIWDGSIKKVFASQIQPRLAQCASPDLFFEVGPDDNMEDAMTKLFVKAASGAKNLRLTN